MTPLPIEQMPATIARLAEDEHTAARCKRANIALLEKWAEEFAGHKSYVAHTRETIRSEREALRYHATRYLELRRRLRAAVARVDTLTAAAAKAAEETRPQDAPLLTPRLVSSVALAAGGRR